MGITVKTKPYGEIKVDDRQVIDFPEGILGFDYIKKFILLDSDDEQSPLKWLQAYEEPTLAFVIIRPADFMKEYELVISQNDIETVKAKNVNELIVFSIVTIPENAADMTANLQGPIIINPVKKIGKQAILLTDSYSVRHRILDEIQKRSGSEG